MANAEVNDLTNKTTPVSTDEVELQETSGGDSKKATLGNVSKAITITESQISDLGTYSTATGVQDGADVTAEVPADTIAISKLAYAIGPIFMGRNSGVSGSYSTIPMSTARTMLSVEEDADVTDTTNVTSAGALMDSEVTNLAQVKAFDSSDYATAAQGSLAASASQATGVENNADVTDATNVNAAGATMNTDSTMAGNSYFLDEDAMGSDSATKVASQQSIKAYVDAQITAAKLVDNPIGTILTNITGTNPSTYIGGTWIAFGTGRVPVGLDSGDTDFDTAEETGGDKDLQAHDHSVTDPGHTHVAGASGYYAYGGAIRAPDNESGYGTSFASITTGSRTTGLTVDSEGDGSADNLQPYIVVYMWKRTA